jgi:nucleoside phosphorylase
METTAEDGRPRATAVVLTALGLEYDAVRARLESWEDLRSSGGTRFEVGEFEGAHVDWHVCVAEIGPGNEDAAVETDRAISEFDPDVILFVGVAGGFKDDLKHGDVVVEKVYSYAGGKAAEEFYPRPEAFSTLRSLGQLVETVRRGRWLVADDTGEFPDQPDVQFKPITAGPNVITSKRSEVAERIKRHYNDTVAVDMESAGMYRVAQRYAGLPALAVRGISDLLDDKTAEADADRQPKAAWHAAAFAFALLDAMDPDDLKLRPAATALASRTETQLGALLAKLPPNVVAELERARTDSVEDATALIRRLARDDAPPAQLVARLLTEQPEWLVRSNSSLLVGSTPRNVPLCVPLEVTLVATNSPSASWARSPPWRTSEAGPRRRRC